MLSLLIMNREQRKRIVIAVTCMAVAVAHEESARTLEWLAFWKGDIFVSRKGPKKARDNGTCLTCLRKAITGRAS